MPDLLKRNARCIQCNEPIDAIVRTENSEGLTVEFYHAKASPKARRKRRCKVWFRAPVPARWRKIANEGA